MDIKEEECVMLWVRRAAGVMMVIVGEKGASTCD
jgi:hypothetical protein